MRYFELCDLDFTNEYGDYSDIVDEREIENPKEWVEERNNVTGIGFSFTYHLSETNGAITKTDDLDNDRQDSTWYCPENEILNYVSKEAYEQYMKGN
jgi:hypothetical protein